MDPNNAIEIRNISKTYKIKIKNTEKKGSLFNKKPMKVIENKVIDNVSLDIKKGDVLGVLGRNGSGKSTFLSLLARIMEPDCGTIERSGKIASILELGMGFHNDMSGRENIYLKGELYGFSKEEIDERIDHIIEYSGIEKYIDNPVRTYSSGMTGRLAFAIMVNVDSEIMLVDEVLSVGDATFESKAKEHFKKMSAGGKTVVFVSHNISTLESMCNRGIWIEGGKILKDGPIKDVVAEYQNMINESPEIISDLANAGVADSQFKLAHMYRDGVVYQKNLELYEELIKKAAIQGHTKAQIEYGDILLKQDKSSEAAEYYRIAADKGDGQARMKMSALNSSYKDDVNELLKIYRQLAIPGDGLNEFRYADLIMKTTWDDESKSEAFDYFTKSADDGYPNAMYQVGLMYRDGNGTTRDLTKMEYYLTKSADNGFIPAITLLAEIYTQGKIVQKDEQKAFEWTLKASRLGNVLSMYRLAMMYRNGIGTDVDIKKSEEWFKLYSEAGLFWYRVWAADYIRSGMIETNQTAGTLYNSIVDNCNPWTIECGINYNIINDLDYSKNLEKLEFLANNGNIDAMKRMGNMYYDGIGVERNYSMSIEWYKKSAMMGDSWSKMRLGIMYCEGQGTDIDYEEAVYWFKESAKQGNIISLWKIVGLYAENKINDVKLLNFALGILESNANSGNMDAIKRIGIIYSGGFGIEKNDKKMDEWLQRVKKLGNLWDDIGADENNKNMKDDDSQGELKNN